MIERSRQAKQIGVCGGGVGVGGGEGVEVAGGARAGRTFTGKAPFAPRRNDLEILALSRCLIMNIVFCPSNQRPTSMLFYGHKFGKEIPTSTNSEAQILEDVTLSNFFCSFSRLAHIAPCPFSRQQRGESFALLLRPLCIRALRPNIIISRSIRAANRRAGCFLPFRPRAYSAIPWS
ncbi:hypothetical protein MPTK1_4g08710 [Marchantia polymorpha subsp. ruderalis]|uniref:Uncharacterized protein n=2 Tax=Marchantia polymorpha TaxID=3197 RepID=A0AAF6B7U6_MARPO|nr:hypothetical protein MARPO_0157s0008 [Marchantia polymorpha]BBN08080.1 hypothetical protein Mp_4g08710 [Marchantia polymorpha subsp. ruderalis]|eukprot:PTQ28676.1 hypothetical protein MARPO_0157s0008 [Marchantia polymorpha]